MYEIWIDSEQFSGKRLIQQHRMVNEVGTMIIINIANLLNLLLFAGIRGNGSEVTAWTDCKDW